MKIIILLLTQLAITGFAKLICIDEKDCYPDIFEPDPSGAYTRIREGQKLPKGLSIRINLQTGEKEAKKDILYEYSKKKSNDDTNKSIIAPKNPVSHDTYLDKFLSGLGDRREREKDFEILEGESHEYEFGNVMVNGEYFNKLVQSMIDSKDLTYKTNCCIILGNCLQNNSVVQLHADSLNFIEILKNIIISINRIDDHTLSRRCFFMAASYLRGNTSIFTKYFELKYPELLEDAFKKSSQVDVKIKILLILADVFIDCAENGQLSIPPFPQAISIINLVKHLSELNLSVFEIDTCAQTLIRVHDYFLKNNLDSQSFQSLSVIFQNLKNQLNHQPSSEFVSQIFDQLRLFTKDIGVHLEL